MARIRKINGFEEKIKELGDLKLISKDDPRILILRIMSWGLKDDSLPFINLMMEKLDELGNYGEVDPEDSRLLMVLTILEDELEGGARMPKAKPKKGVIKINAPLIQWLIDQRGYESVNAFSSSLGKYVSWMWGILNRGNTSKETLSYVAEALDVPVERLILKEAGK